MRISQFLGSGYTVISDMGCMFRIDAKDADALGLSAPATVEQEAPGTQNLTLRANLTTLGMLAAKQVSYKEAIAQDMLRIDGPEAEIANFLAHFETLNS